MRSFPHLLGSGFLWKVLKQEPFVLGVEAGIAVAYSFSYDGLQLQVLIFLK